MAIYLARAGYSVHIYEKRSDPRRARSNSARALNLVISKGSIRLLDEAGLSGHIREAALPLKGRMMHSRSGDLRFRDWSSASPSSSRECPARAGGRKPAWGRGPLRAQSRRLRSRDWYLNRSRPARPADDDFRRRCYWGRWYVFRHTTKDGAAADVHSASATPRVRIQGIAHSPRPGRWLLNGETRAPHMAPGRVHHERPAQLRRLVQRQSVPASFGREQFRLTGS